MKPDSIFYEDTKKIKQYVFIFTLLFYIGFIAGLIAIVVYHIVKPAHLLETYRPNGEEFVATFLCFFSAIYFNIVLVKAKNIYQAICIGVNEINFRVNDKQFKFNTQDLLGYRVIKKYAFHKAYILLFQDDIRLRIVSSKKKNLEKVLDIIISDNKKVLNSA